VILLFASLPARYGLLYDQAMALGAGQPGSHVSPAGFAIFVTLCESAAAAGFFVVAGVLFVRRRNDPVALFASLALTAFGAGVPETMFAIASGRPIWDVPSAPIQGLGWLLLLVFAYVFPDGRFVPRWTRWLAVFWAAWVAAFFIFAGVWADQGGWAIAAMFLIWAGWLGTGWLAQGYRYVWVSNASQRQQTKWVVVGFVCALAGAFVVVAYHILTLAQGAASHEGITPRMASAAVLAVSLLLIPGTIGVAILRYQLYDIDRIINRALVYGLLTAVLAVIYAGCVFTLEQVFSRTVGQTTPAVVLSTLAVAALFRPLRSRVQQAIDRRFYRTKYDAARTLAAFGASLASEADIEQLQVRLIEAVRESMQPENVSLWLQPRQRPSAW
jgi:hypothetical protein